MNNICILKFWQLGNIGFLYLLYLSQKDFALKNVNDKKHTNRSHNLFHLVRQLFLIANTVLSLLNLSLTSIDASIHFYSMHLFKRFAATAAPPVRSLVFTINTLIHLFSYYKDKSFKRNNRKMLQRMI